jgi:hypothetical protein
METLRRYKFVNLETKAKQDIVAPGFEAAKQIMGQLSNARGDKGDWEWVPDAAGWVVKNPKPHKVNSTRFLFDPITAESKDWRFWVRVVIINPDDTTQMFTMPSWVASPALQAMVKVNNFSDIFVNGVQVKNEREVLDILGGTVLTINF